MGAGLHSRVVADDGGTFDAGVGAHLRPLAQPHALRKTEPGNVDIDLAVEHVLVGAQVGVEVPDVLPVAVGDEPVERLLLREQEREHVGREVDHALADVVEDLWFEDVDAGVHRVAEHLAPRRLLEEALDAPVGPGDHDAELERVVHRLQGDGGQRSALLVEADHGREVDIGEHVARDHEERLVELVARVAHRAGGAQGRLLGGVHHPHAELGPVAEVRADGVGHEGHGHDDVVEAVLLQQPHDVLHHRPVGQRDHRLGLVRRERSEAGALAPGHDDRLHLELDPTAEDAASRASRPSARARRASGT